WENRLKIARVVREQRPRVVILPYWKGRHPDHYTCATLGYEACFLAGLSKLELQDASLLRPPLPKSGQSAGEMPLAAHRPFNIVYATLYYDVRQSFVFDIPGQLEARLEWFSAYKPQFPDQDAGRVASPAYAEIRERVATMARYYGMLAGVKYA